MTEQACRKIHRYRVGVTAAHAGIFDVAHICMVVLASNTDHACTDIDVAVPGAANSSESTNSCVIAADRVSRERLRVKRYV